MSEGAKKDPVQSESLEEGNKHKETTSTESHFTNQLKDLRLQDGVDTIDKPHRYDITPDTVENERRLDHVKEYIQTDKVILSNSHL